jgi:hypothetical protein
MRAVYYGERYGMKQGAASKYLSCSPPIAPTSVSRSLTPGEGNQL